jgi:hypothetical protein
MDAAAWMHGLVLEQYAPTFRYNAIDRAVLRELTVDDLKDLPASPENRYYSRQILGSLR